MRLYSIRVGTGALVVYTLLLGVLKGHAAYYPVSPWTSPPLFTQDFGCIGKENLAGMGSSIKGSDGEPFDICYKSGGIHDGLDQIPACSKPPSTCKDTDWEIRAPSSGTVKYVKRDCPDSNEDCYHRFGNTVVYLGDDGRYHGFHHMNPNSIPASITVDTRVSRGLKLGVMGSTGIVTGRHLHQSTWKIDPRLNDDKPAVDVKYKPSHPANFGTSIDPFTVLNPPIRKLLFVKTADANIYRGPGTKYSVFAKGVKDCLFVQP